MARYGPRRVASKLGEWFFNGVLALLPNRVFGGIRVAALRAMGAEVGDRVKISRRVKVLGATGLTIEDDAALAHSVVLDARGGLTIGAGALIGFESVLLTYTHAWPDPDLPVHRQGAVSAPVTIGGLAWLGARVFVLPGVTIGESSVVGAGSIVSKSIPAGKVAAGNPCTVVSDRRRRES